MTTLRKTFATPHEQHADRRGQAFEVVRKITEPDDTHDAESLPMYVIRFPDSIEIEAWPDEIEDPEDDDATVLDKFRRCGITGAKARLRRAYLFCSTECELSHFNKLEIRV